MKGAFIMSLIDTIISKALEFEGVSESPPGSNNVIFNTDYYGEEVEGEAYPWCVTFLWDVFRMCNASSVFCDGQKTASTEFVYSHYNDGRLFSQGQAGDIVLIKTSSAASNRNVNHAGLVIKRNNDGSYDTVEGNTGGNIADGGAVMRRTRSMNGSGYKIVAFARPTYGAIEPMEEIAISAKLTVQGTNVNVRTSPNTNAFIVKKLNTGAEIQASSRVLINGDPWFHFSDGWINGNYVQGWVKDYNDNNRWWYVEKGYIYPKSEWKTIAGKDYCFGLDGYLFVECYIKSEVNSNYYWVDDDGVYMSQYDTTTPDRKYRVVENYKTENAYQGYSGYVFSH